MSRYRAPLPAHRDPVSRIAARFRRAELRSIDAQHVADTIRETGEHPDAGVIATAGGDAEKLRGIPALGPGVGGTQRGTDPLRETMRRDGQRRRQIERTSL